MENPAPVQASARNDLLIVAGCSTGGLLLVLVLAWCLFLRPSWEDSHRTQLLATLSEADALIAEGRASDARAKYAQAFELVGTHRIESAYLQDRLEAARLAMVRAAELAGPMTPPGASANASLAEVFGDRLRSCQVDPDGTIYADHECELTLQGTQGDDFTLSGELWFTSQPSQYDGGGVIFHLREHDGMHRYEVTLRGLRAKRVLLGGRPVAQFANPIEFAGVPTDRWVPFSITFDNAAGIDVRFAEQNGRVAGPLSRDGRNVIVLSPGGRIRNVSVQHAGLNAGLKDRRALG